MSECLRKIKLDGASQVKLLGIAQMKMVRNFEKTRNYLSAVLLVSTVSAKAVNLTLG